MKKRLLSALLALCMMLTMMPAAFAADGDDSEVSTQAQTSLPDANDNGVITLTEDCTLSSDVQISGNITLDLGSSTINTAGYSIVIPDGSSLTVTGSGTVKNEVVATQENLHDLFKVHEGGTLTIESGNFSTKAAQALNISGIAFVNGGTFTCTAQKEELDPIASKSLVQVNGANASLTMTNGTIDADTNDPADGQEARIIYGIYARSGATVVLGTKDSDEGPTINSGYPVFALNNTTSDPAINLTIYGGTYSAGFKSYNLIYNSVFYLSGGCNVTIYGGTYTANETYTRMFSIPYKNVSARLNVYGGTYTATSGKYIVFTYGGDGMGETGENALDISGGTFKYNTFSEFNSNDRFDDFITGGTFSSDVSEYVAANYQCKEDPENSGTYVVTQVAAGSMTVKPEVGSGNVTATLEGIYNGNSTTVDDNNQQGDSDTGAKDGAVTVDLSTENAENAASATLTMPAETAKSLGGANGADSLTVKTNVGSVKLDSAALGKMVNADTEVAITITSNNIEGQSDVKASYTVEVKSGEKNLLPESDADNGTITITIPCPESLRNATELFVYYIKNDIPYQRMDAKLTNDNQDITFTTTHLSQYAVYSSQPDAANYAAEVNGTPYSTLAGAITAAGEKATVKLMKNVTEDITIDPDDDIILDLNGYKITNSNDHTITNNGTLTIEDNSEAKTGTVDNVTHAKAAIYNHGTMTIEGGLYTRSKETQDYVDDGPDNSWYTIVNAGAMTINGGTFTTADGQPENLGNRSSLIRNGDSDSNSNVCLTITGGTFTSGANVIKNEAGSVIESISGGTFTMDNSEIAWYGGNNLLQSYGTIHSITGGTFIARGSGIAIDEAGSDDPEYFRHGIGVYGEGCIKEIGGEVSFLMEGTQNCLIRCDGSSINITGGSYKLEEETSDNNVLIREPNNHEVISISGGNYSSSVSEYVIANLNYEVNSGSGDTPYSYYKTADEAMKAAGTTGTVTVVGKDSSETHIVTFNYNYSGKAEQTIAEQTIEVLDKETITLPNPTRPDYDLEGWRSSADNDLHKAGDKVEITSDVTFVADWDRRSSGGSSSGGGSSSSNRYTVSVDSGIDNGDISVSPSRAERGDTVTITVDPDEGYELDSLVVTDNRGNRIAVDKESDTRYTFEMPAGRVSIDATFTEVTEQPQPEPSSEPFADVNTGDWFYDAVVYAYENGMMNGTASNLFTPNGTTTRAMIVTILHRLENEPNAAVSGFTDVAANAYYADAVNWAAANGIVNGTSATTFAPNSPITREQMAAILYRYAQFKGYDTSIGGMSLNEYADASQISSYATTAMQWANENGLITGRTSTTLAPQGTATRAEVATILMRFCEDVAK